MLAPFFLALLMVQQAQPTSTTAQTIKPSELGPQVGEQVPDFSAPDQDGRQRSLASLMGPNGLMLVFFRSADW